MAGRAMTKIWPKWLDRVNYRGEAEVIDAVQSHGPYFSHSHPGRDQKLLYHTIIAVIKFIWHVKHRNFVVFVISKHLLCARTGVEESRVLRIRRDSHARYWARLILLPERMGRDQELRVTGQNQEWHKENYIINGQFGCSVKLAGFILAVYLMLYHLVIYWHWS